MPSSMQIESMAIKNYRCFREIVLNELPRMTIVVGANGSGKSSLFDVFTFLKGNYSASSGKLFEKERSSVKKTKNDRRKA